MNSLRSDPVPLGEGTAPLRVVAERPTVHHPPPDDLTVARCAEKAEHVPQRGTAASATMMTGQQLDRQDANRRLRKGCQSLPTEPGACSAARSRDGIRYQDRGESPTLKSASLRPG